MKYHWKIFVPLSAEVYTTKSTTTAFNNWKEGINHINKYDYILHTVSGNTLVVVLGNKSCVLWGDTKTVQNLSWDIIIVYFDAITKRIYLNSSIKNKRREFLKHIFSSPIKVQNDSLFRVFANVQRLRLFNVGARLHKEKIFHFSHIMEEAYKME